LLAPNEVSQVEWYLNGTEIPINNTKYEIIFKPDQGVCSLVISNVNKVDSGEYSCRVVSNFGEHLSKCVVKVQPSKVIQFSQSLNDSYEFKLGENARYFYLFFTRLIIIIYSRKFNLK